MISRDKKIFYEAKEKIDALFRAKIPEKMGISRYSDEIEKQYTESINQLIDFVSEISEFILPLSQGKLNPKIPRTKNFLASPFKELHSRLKHLTWQAQQISKGDYSQRIDFMGDFSEAFNSMVIYLAQKEKELKQKVAQLEDSNKEIQQEVKERKQAEEALRESTERLETILQSMPVGIMIIDSETHEIVDANPKAILMIGVPLEHFIGSQCHNFICSAKKGRCPITDFGQSVDNSECVLLDANGKSVPTFKTVIPIEIDDRKFLIECFVDISEHKRAEQERIEKEKLQGVIEMAGAVCHEMNQPLQAVSGYSELVMMAVEDDNPLYDKINKIKKQVDRMGDITQKLMGITKYETKDYLKGKIIDIDKAT